MLLCFGVGDQHSGIVVLLKSSRQSTDPIFLVAFITYLITFTHKRRASRPRRWATRPRPTTQESRSLRRRVNGALLHAHRWGITLESIISRRFARGALPRGRAPSAVQAPASPAAAAPGSGGGSPRCRARHAAAVPRSGRGAWVLYEAGVPAGVLHGWWDAQEEVTFGRPSRPHAALGPPSGRPLSRCEHAEAPCVEDEQQSRRVRVVPHLAGRGGGGG